MARALLRRLSGGKAAAGSTWVQVPGTAGMPAGSLQPGSHQLLWALLPRSSRQHGEQTERSHPRASQTRYAARLCPQLRSSCASRAAFHQRMKPRPQPKPCWQVLQPTAARHQPLTGPEQPHPLHPPLGAASHGMQGGHPELGVFPVVPEQLGVERAFKAPLVRPPVTQEADLDCWTAPQ